MTATAEGTHTWTYRQDGLKDQCRPAANRPNRFGLSPSRLAMIYLMVLMVKAAGYQANLEREEATR